MTDDIVSSLRRALTEGRLSALADHHYRPTTTLESYVDGRRDIVTGPGPAGGRWPDVVRGPGVVTRFAVTVLAGGYEIDVQRSMPPGGAVRQLHRLSVVDRSVARHLVYPALPWERPVLPANSLTLEPGSVTELPHEGFSGAALFRARYRDGRPVVVKHIRPARDWLARASRDPGREGLLHTEGGYASLPAGITSPVIDAEPVEDGWLIVMRDVTAELTRVGDGRTTHEALLTGLHAMHTAFAGAPPRAALCSLEDRLRLFSPLRPLVERRGTDLLPKTLTTTWECFVDGAGEALADTVLRLVMDPTELLRALRDAAPTTLLHGDYRPPNLGLRDGTVVTLDWGLACAGPADLDFVWFVSNTAWDGADECEHLESVWTRLTGRGRNTSDTRALDLAVVFHAVMGELAFVMTEASHQPDGFTRPAPDTVAWWLRRLDAALTRTGDLVHRRSTR